MEILVQIPWFFASILKINGRSAKFGGYQNFSFEAFFSVG